MRPALGAVSNLQMACGCIRSELGNRKVGDQRTFEQYIESRCTPQITFLGGSGGLVQPARWGFPQNTCTRVHGRHEAVPAAVPYRAFGTCTCLYTCTGQSTCAHGLYLVDSLHCCSAYCRGECETIRLAAIAVIHVVGYTPLRGISTAGR